MENRREFLKKVAFFSATSLHAGLFRSIEKAFAITADPHTTYLDAEHIVILMQENRSFDHMFGTLRGVRGYGDPRSITLANGNPVWLQSGRSGIGSIPFRLDMNQTKATWMGSLPHAWKTQVDARNGGQHDGWIDAKAPSNPEYSSFPFTLGFYERRDLPFYYSLADSFTICDQYFCSSLTGTNPNRLFHWTGTIRAEPRASSPAMVNNGDVSSDQEGHWTTFPERLEDAGISWKFYQNEISLSTGLSGEEGDWLANFDDNPLEWFAQYQVRYSVRYHEYLKKVSPGHPDLLKWSPENFAKLSTREQNLHLKAFTTNAQDPFSHELAELTYSLHGKNNTLKAPKGDVLDQFRKDALNGTLPTVSWLAAPENFSDHPAAPWYGAWYVSQVLDILTHRPELWKKTVFILNYDENDGYFDHIPPFVPPHPTQPNTGLVSPGIDPAVEYVLSGQMHPGTPADDVRESPIGMGFRVPAIIASPWTRGGCVCSEIFDHTSVLQFLEHFLSHKTGKPIQETHISRWRRTVTGNLTSAFQAGADCQVPPIPFPARDEFVEDIHRAQFRDEPKNYRVISPADRVAIRNGAMPLGMSGQEKGVRKSAPLPYELAVHGGVDRENRHFKIQFEAPKNSFGLASDGVPFMVRAVYPGANGAEKIQIRNYAVSAGGILEDVWSLAEFSPHPYLFKVYGPNGFFREFSGTENDPPVSITAHYAKGLNGKKSGRIQLSVENKNATLDSTILIKDLSYGTASLTRLIHANSTETVDIDLHSSFHWYDLRVDIAGHDQFYQRFAGRVETGKWGMSDPALNE
jgi:phospholipase C